MFITVHNPTAQPVVIDHDGHSLGGGEFGTVNDAEDAVKTALIMGLLRAIDRPSSEIDLDQGARDAFNATDAANGSKDSRPKKETSN